VVFHPEAENSIIDYLRDQNLHMENLNADDRKNINDLLPKDEELLFQ